MSSSLGRSSCVWLLMESGSKHWREPARNVTLGTRGALSKLRVHKTQSKRVFLVALARLCYVRIWLQRYDDGNLTPVNGKSLPAAAHPRTPKRRIHPSTSAAPFRCCHGCSKTNTQPKFALGDEEIEFWRHTIALWERKTHQHKRSAPMRKPAANSEKRSRIFHLASGIVTVCQFLHYTIAGRWLPKISVPQDITRINYVQYAQQFELHNQNKTSSGFKSKFNRLLWLKIWSWYHCVSLKGK